MQTGAHCMECHDHAEHLGEEEYYQNEYWEKLGSWMDISRGNISWLGKNRSCWISSFIILETRGILDTDVIKELARRARTNLAYLPSNLPAITGAASLAHHRLLGSVDLMRLYNVDLTSVQAEYLASLVLSVRGYVSIGIDYVSGRDLVIILDSVKC